MISPDEVLKQFGERIRERRNALGLSQESLGFRSDLDRTYISDIERGVRNVSLLNIVRLAKALDVGPSDLFGSKSHRATTDLPSYRLRDGFHINCGFELTGQDVLKAVQRTAEEMQALPFSLFKSISLKAVSGMVGALYATSIAQRTSGIVNPIEKGHPDIIPQEGIDAPEEKLRDYGVGLEIKCTVGGVEKGSDLSSGEGRIEHLKSITWQAHHREVKSLMGLVIDFAGQEMRGGRYPVITGVFYSDNLCKNDWGKISGTTGRNTKVTGMLVSGKSKMGDGWVVIYNDNLVMSRYSSILKFEM